MNLQDGEAIRLGLTVIASLGVGAIIVELIRSRVQRPQMNADTAKVLTEAATSLLKPLQERVVDLTAEIKVAERDTEHAKEELEGALRECERIRQKFHDANSEIEHLRARIRVYEQELDDEHPRDGERVTRTEAAPTRLPEQPPVETDH